MWGPEVRAGSLNTVRWLANLVASRTTPSMTFTLTTRRPDLPLEPERTFRNPIIYARELKAEMEA